MVTVEFGYIGQSVKNWTNKVPIHAKGGFEGRIEKMSLKKVTERFS